jgi:hypothetical protein
VTNDSDIDVETMQLRGAAFMAADHATAALETFTAALAKTANRHTGLLNVVRYDRALVYEQLGQQKRARADLERIYSTDRRSRTSRAASQRWLTQGTPPGQPFADRGSLPVAALLGRPVPARSPEADSGPRWSRSPRKVPHTVGGTDLGAPGDPS